MSNEAVHLQFTQEDRDMIRDTNRDVKQILDKMEDHGEDFEALQERVAKLETWQTRAVAVIAFAGFLVGLVAKAVWK